MDDLDDDPILEVKSFRHHGGVNRLRVMPQAPHILATQSDQKVVRVYDTKELLGALDKPPRKSLPPLKPVFTFKGHADEGYAMDWSRAVQGRMVTGDCSKFIYLWEPKQGGWAVNNIPYKGHTGSVEDLQWSPTEANVFISCSTDKTIRVWDTRCRTKSMLWVAAHKQDVNVVSWNKNVSHLLLSGSDDGSVKIWDLRNFKASEPAANFKWHRGAITSVDWHPTDESILAVSSADNSISVWDMGLEPDSDAASRGADVHGMEIPDQLLFVHQGQRDIKEVHFHPQIPSMIISTAGDGFNIFKPSNMQTLDENKR